MKDGLARGSWGAQLLISKVKCFPHLHHKWLHGRGKSQSELKGDNAHSGCIPNIQRCFQQASKHAYPVSVAIGALGSGDLGTLMQTISHVLAGRYSGRALSTA